MTWMVLDGWKWIFGLLGFAWVCAVRMESAIGDRSTFRSLPPLVVLAVLTFAVRRLVVDQGFFQHVGRGASWVCEAHDPSGQPYGRGFFEVFGFIVEFFPTTPERALFEAQAMLGACVPSFAWLIVRYTGGRPIVAWAFAGIVALHPALARAAASESYYATCTFLLFAAGATLAVATQRPRPHTRSLGVGCISAALLLSQAMAVHPLSWVPAALVPLITLVGGGRLRRRLTTFALASASFAVIGGFGLAERVVRLLSEDGSSAGMAGEMLIARGGLAIPIVSLALLGLGLSITTTPTRRRWRLVVLVGAISTQAALQLIGLLDLPAAGAHVHAFLASPAIFASLGALAQTRNASRRLLLGVLVVAGVTVAPFAREMLRRTTESLENSWLTSRRAELPSNALVAFVHERDQIETKLPFYGHCGLGGPSPFELEHATATPRPTVDRPVYYYRSSLCSTSVGYALCEERERSLVLVPVARTRLPAFSQKVRIRVAENGTPTVTPMRYRTQEIEVVLYRIERVLR